MGRNDRRILAKVCAGNGGGVDLTHEPDAPVVRLIKAGLIQPKAGPFGGRGWVHTPAGWEANKANAPVAQVAG